jgi:hypothetical protein
MDENNANIDFKKLFDTDKKKADAFDRIAEKYYFNNFGTFSKSEIDLLMFDIYLEQSIINNKLNDDLVDYNAVSDYKMARNLGITPQRIRNLKVKKQYVYPVKFDWKESLANILNDDKNIHIVDNKIIKINIPDPNLFLAIQEEIEAEGGYLDIQLNSRLLSVPIDNFMIIVKLISREDEYDKICEKVIEKYNSINKENKIEKGLATTKQITSIVKDITGSINDIVSVVTPNNIIIKAISNIFSIFKSNL